MLTQAGTLLTALGLGAAAGMQFNVIAAAVSAALAAGVSGYKRAPRAHLWWSAGILLAGWGIGDGIRLAGESGSGARTIAWAVLSLAVGYVLPAVTGAYVGRLVHKGTGYLSAGVVALTLVPALAQVGDTLGPALARLLG